MSIPSLRSCLQRHFLEEACGRVGAQTAVVSSMVCSPVSSWQTILSSSRNSHVFPPDALRDSASSLCAHSILFGIIRNSANNKIYHTLLLSVDLAQGCRVLCFGG